MSKDDEILFCATAVQCLFCCVPSGIPFLADAFHPQRLSTLSTGKVTWDEVISSQA